MNQTVIADHPLLWSPGDINFLADYAALLVRCKKSDIGGVATASDTNNAFAAVLFPLGASLTIRFTGCHTTHRARSQARTPLDSVATFG
jgi:hypothetical protein